MVTVEVAINSTRGAQHFALHPAGIALPWRFGLELINLYEYRIARICLKESAW